MSKLITVHESEWDRLEKLVEDITYTAKNRKKKMHLYRDALIEIGHWTQETQDSAKELDSEGAMWRGCVAQANMALEEGGDAVDGRQRVYPEGYLERKKENE
jgi:hypothetical protein